METRVRMAVDHRLLPDLIEVALCLFPVTWLQQMLADKCWFYTDVMAVTVNPTVACISSDYMGVCQSGIRMDCSGATKMDGWLFQLLTELMCVGDKVDITLFTHESTVHISKIEDMFSILSCPSTHYKEILSMWAIILCYLSIVL